MNNPDGPLDATVRKVRAGLMPEGDDLQEPGASYPRRSTAGFPVVWMHP